MEHLLKVVIDGQAFLYAQHMGLLSEMHGKEASEKEFEDWQDEWKESTFELAMELADKEADDEEDENGVVGDRAKGYW